MYPSRSAPVLPSVLFKTLFFTALSLAGAADARADTWQIQPLGLSGSEYSSSYLSALNEAGQVAGRSSFSSATSYGTATWLYDGVDTRRTGFYGALQTRNDGFQSSRTTALSQSGQVVGSSLNFQNGKAIGRVAWISDGVSTVQIGLNGAEFTASNGVYQSHASAINDAGQAIGSTYRYTSTVPTLYDNFVSSSNDGRAAWLYDGANTIRLGFTDPVHTGANNRQYSVAVALNNAGQVVGTSMRAQGGYSAWRYNSGVTQKIGLTSGAYVSSANIEVHNVTRLNQAGQAVGSSYRYNGGSSVVGVGAWLYDGSNTVEVGLKNNPAYTASRAGFLNDAGDVAGVSNAGSASTLNPETTWNDDLSQGQSAWVYRNGQTTQLGFRGGKYTNSAGVERSDVTGMNQNGQVIGHSIAFIPNAVYQEGSQEAWFFDGADTHRVGLTDEVHTNEGLDLQSSTAEMINDAGQVVGFSTRFDDNDPLGVGSLGQSAWFYDPTLDQTFDLTMLEEEDGFAYSEVLYLGDDGLVLGWYQDRLSSTTFDAHAFAFSLDDGLLDLSDMLLLSGLDVTDAGWTDLFLSSTHGFGANASGQIAAQGVRNGVSTGYLLTPSAVPVPAALWMFSSALLGLVQLRRTRR